METTTQQESPTLTGDRKMTGVSTTSDKRLAWRKVAFWSSLAIVPAAVAALGSRRSRLLGGVVGGLTALAMAGFRWQFQRWFAAEPSYEVEKRVGPIEIRRYDAHVEARTHVLTENHDTALETGFRRLASYIFGGNHRESNVTDRPKSGERIEMTSPVINQRSGVGHVMSFVMPPGRDQD